MPCKHHAFYSLPDKIHLRTDVTFTIRISCKKSYTLPPFPSSFLNKSKVWGTGGVGIKKKGRYVFFSHLQVCITRKTPQCPMSASLCWSSHLSQVKSKSLSLVWLFATHGLYSPWNSPGQKTGVGSRSLLQGIFPTQGLNPGLPHCRRILYQLSQKGSPN